jgi:dTDP-glucose 4,6-dehydratase
MKVLITGGAGFIGSSAVKHFQKMNDNVIVLDKLSYAAKEHNIEDCELIKVDICETDKVKKIVTDFTPDVIINFAAETHVDNSILSVSEFIHSNFIGVSSLLEVCKETGTKLCHISTDEVYGPADQHAFTEEDALNPMNPYSATKASADLLIKSFYNTHKVPFLIIRPSNNYGPNQHNEKFIPKLLQSIKEKKKFPLYGNGLQVREWTFVEDTVQLIREIIIKEKDWNSIYNITSGISKTNLEVIATVVKHYNEHFNENITLSEVIQTVDDRKGHDKKYWISCDKLNQICAYNHKEFNDVIKMIIAS